MIRLPFFLLALIAVPAEAAPDLIIVNAKVFTADPGRPSAEVVAIEDGRIVFVGNADEAQPMAGPETRFIDARGRLLVPGLVEAHAHAGPGPAGTRIDIPGSLWPGASGEEVLAAVRAAVARGGEGWLVATIGPAMMSDERDWRSALDEAAPGRPVMLLPWWGHGTTVNSRALALLRIGEDAKDPPGGWYGRRADGRLDGRIREGAEIAVIRRLASEASSAEAAAAFREESRELTRMGITSVHQMAHNLGLARTLAAIAEAGPGIKWSVYAWGLPTKGPAEAWREFKAPGPIPANARVAGGKWMLDGTPIERGALMREVYGDRPGWSGRANFTDAQLLEILRAALVRPQQMAFHVTGDGMAAKLFAAMEAVAPAEAWRHRRVRIEHGDGMTADLLPAAKRLGVVIVANPLHLAPSRLETGGEMMETRLGNARAKRFQLMRSVIEAGVPLALGSDAGGPAASPFLNMMMAVAYQRNPAEALTREQALTAYTATGAFAEGEEARKGRIAVGMAADLALLSQDILTVPLPALPATRSVLTVVDGRIVHEEEAAEK
jgi:hypothetical protein